jgi:protein-tyrosine phosphatase
MDDRKRRKPVGGRVKRRGLPSPKSEVIVRAGRDPWPGSRPPATGSGGRTPAARLPAMPRLNFDWVTEQLAVGGQFPREGVEVLARAHGISRVVDLRGEDCDDELLLARHGIRLLHLPTEYCGAMAPEAIARGVAWVVAALRARHRVLIHCQHGSGRGALLTMCVLIESGLSPLATMTLAKDARAAVSPSPDQLRAMMAFAQERAAGRSWTVPPFEELAAIAYRHLAWKAGELGSGTTGG